MKFRAQTTYRWIRQKGQLDVCGFAIDRGGVPQLQPAWGVEQPLPSRQSR